ncbi:18038_t:CDS:2 [Funneliformis geosporum]|nr:18038_t:CDS:2 [Funneliformis geosporum]
MFQLVRNRHSGNILRTISHTTRGITSNSTVQVLPDNLNSHQLETVNEDDDLISRQSELDNVETKSSEASSPDEWKFLFETVIEEENKDKERVRHQSTFDRHDNHIRYDRHLPSPRKRQSSREEIYRESQKRFIPYEKNEGAFHRIFRTLLDSNNYERWKGTRLDKMNDESKSSTIEQYLYDLMRRGEEQQPMSEQQGNQFEQEDDVPNESMKATSLLNVFNEPEKEAIEIKNELLKCETKKRFQEIISKNIFGVDHENSIKSKRVVDDFNRPFPFRYEIRGLLSYVLGCSTRVYNQILLIRWEFWKDIKGIERLLDEMKYNGVSFNDETYKIISDIHLEVASYTNSEKWDLFDVKAYKNETPLPENIPRVDDVGTTSAPLKSAAFFIGAYCKEFNDDYMLCKNENNDPKHCLKEGRKVTRCTIELLRKLRENCDKEFETHWQCLDKNNQEYYQCRPQEKTFNSCVFNALNLEKVIPGTPQGKPPIHLKDSPIFKPS